MKKIILLLLLVLTIASLASCANECKHIYDNACDTVCNNCEKEREITHSWVAADCDTPKTCSVCGATEGEALGHDWSDKNGTCKNDNTHTCNHDGATSGTCPTCEKDLGGATQPPVEHTHSGTLVKGTAATCTADGWNDYYSCTCGRYFADSTCKTLISNLDDWKAGAGKIDAKDHSWNTTVSYAWNTDYTSCTATRTCKNDSNHVETDTATVTPVTTNATCTDDAYTTYTATFTGTWAAAQTEVVAGDSKTGHDWSDNNGICKNDSTHTCDHGGAMTGTCSVCGNDLNDSLVGVRDWNTGTIIGGEVE